MLEIDVNKSQVPKTKYLKGKSRRENNNPQAGLWRIFVCLIHLKRMHIQRIETWESIGSTLMNLQELGFGEDGEDYLNIFKN